MEEVPRSDPDSILAVQQHMNEIPHANRTVPFPDEATFLLFQKEGSAQGSVRPDKLAELTGQRASVPV
jgi:hypothetical protein